MSTLDELPFPHTRALIEIRDDMLEEPQDMDAHAIIEIAQLALSKPIPNCVRFNTWQEAVKEYQFSHNVFAFTGDDYIDLLKWLYEKS